MLPAIVKFVMKLLPGGFTFPNSSFNEFSPLRTRGFAVFQALGIQTEEYFLKNFLETEVKEVLYYHNHILVITIVLG